MRAENETKQRRPLFAVACKGSELAAAVLAVTGGDAEPRAVTRGGRMTREIAEMWADIIGTYRLTEVRQGPTGQFVVMVKSYISGDWNSYPSAAECFRFALHLAKEDE